MSKKQSTNQKYRDFMLGFFLPDDSYQEVKVNNHWLVKHYDGSKDSWEVYLYTKEAFDNYKKAQSLRREEQERLDFLKSI